jgi:hypothetical protein
MQILKKASGFIPAVQAIRGNRQGTELASRSFLFRFSISLPFTPPSTNGHLLNHLLNVLIEHTQDRREVDLRE